MYYVKHYHIALKHEACWVRNWKQILLSNRLFSSDLLQFPSKWLYLVYSTLALYYYKKKKNDCDFFFVWESKDFSGSWCLKRPKASINWSFPPHSSPLLLLWYLFLLHCDLWIGIQWQLYWMIAKGGEGGLTKNDSWVVGKWLCYSGKDELFVLIGFEWTHLLKNNVRGGICIFYALW